MNTNVTDSDLEQLRTEAEEDGEEELFVLAVKALIGDRHARAECTHIILATRIPATPWTEETKP